MSDTSQGPGWWQASDHKWYPPELYPTEWKKPAPGTESTPAAQSPAQPQGAPPGAAAAAAPTTPPAAHAAPSILGDDWDLPAAGAALPGENPRVPPTRETDAVPPGVSAAHAAPVQPKPAIDWDAPVAPNGALSPGAAPAAQDPVAPPQGWATPDPAPTQAPVVTPQPAPAPADTVFEPPAAVPVEPVAVAPIAPVAPGEPQTSPTPPQSPPASWDLEGSQQPVRTTPRRSTPAAPAQNLDEPGPPDIPAGVIGILGAALLIVGSFLAWAKAAGTLTTGTVNGLSGSNGWGTLICGFVVAFCSIMVMAGRRRPWIGTAMAAAAAVSLGLVVFSIIDIGSTSDELPDVLREENIAEDIAAGAQLELSTGVWIVTAGGAIALIAGIIALARRR